MRLPPSLVVAHALYVVHNMKKPFQVIWVLLLFGCAHTYPLPESNPNGTEEMFASMRSEVDVLEGASKENWISGSGSHQEIQSLRELDELIQPISFTETERMQMFSDYKKAHSVAHFGFDGNYHALVFFNSSGNPIRVEKW
jgi:hypothetical protein